jgi:hypothetical protein
VPSELCASCVWILRRWLRREVSPRSRGANAARQCAARAYWASDLPTHGLLDPCAVIPLSKCSMLSAVPLAYGTCWKIWIRQVGQNGHREYAHRERSIVHSTAPQGRDVLFEQLVVVAEWTIRRSSFAWFSIPDARSGLYTPRQ